MLFLNWNKKEKCLSAFWLICAGILAANHHWQNISLSTFLESMGLILFIASWALMPQFFLQPLKTQTINTKPLLLSLCLFLTFRVVAELLR